MFANSQPLQDAGDRDHSEVAAGELVIPGGDSPVALEAIDHRALTVGLAIVGMVAHFVVAIGDHRLDLARLKLVAEGTAAVALVLSDRAGPNPVQTLSEHGNRLRTLVSLPSGEGDHDRLAGALGDEMEFASPSAATTPYRGITPTFLGLPRPADAPGCCSRRSSSATRPAFHHRRHHAGARRGSQMPASRQRRKRLETVCQGPYRLGTSRQGTPERRIQTMPLSTVR